MSDSNEPATRIRIAGGDSNNEQGQQAVVELTDNDPFQTEAGILVIPCDTSMQVTPEAQKTLEMYGIRSPVPREVAPGYVDPSAVATSGPRHIAFAAINSAELPSEEMAVAVVHQILPPLIEFGQSVVSIAVQFAHMELWQPAHLIEVFSEAFIRHSNPGQTLLICVQHQDMEPFLRETNDSPDQPTFDQGQDLSKKKKKKAAKTKVQKKQTRKTKSHPDDDDKEGPAEAETPHDKETEKGKTDEDKEKNPDKSGGSNIESGGDRGSENKTGDEPQRDEKTPPNAVPAHTDIPTEVDLLDRRAFARAMGRRIRDVRDKHEDPFWINLHGAWGAGKTTVLNFLREDMEESNWLVVEFNAWRYQRHGVPWWSLLNVIFRTAVSHLWKEVDRDTNKRTRWSAIKLWCKEQYWRLSLNWWAHLIVIVVFALMWAAGSNASNAGNSLHAALTLLIGVGGMAFTLRRSLLPGSNRAAEVFTDVNSNPAPILAKHFEKLVDWTGKKIIVFIDDADRCDAAYIVELIERAQTLYKDAPVTYLVAADRRWICSSYDTVYDSHTDFVRSPGRPLGYLFLEKIFQMSIALPRLHPDTQAEFLDKLIHMKDIEPPNRADIAKASEALESLDSEQDVLQAVEQRKSNPIEQRIFRQAAVVRLAAAPIKEHTEHLLQPFAPLLESNPRSMKRFVNAYGIQRSIAMLSGLDIEMERLALWTIMLLRWPTFAEYLESEPEALEAVGAKQIPTEDWDGLPDDDKKYQRKINRLVNAAPEPLRPLFESKAVIEVIRPTVPELQGLAIDANLINQLIGHHANGEGMAPVT